MRTSPMAVSGPTPSWYRQARLFYGKDHDGLAEFCGAGARGTPTRISAASAERLRLRLSKRTGMVYWR